MQRLNVGPACGSHLLSAGRLLMQSSPLKKAGTDGKSPSGSPLPTHRRNFGPSVGSSWFSPRPALTQRRRVEKVGAHQSLSRMQAVKTSSVNVSTGAGRAQRPADWLQRPLGLSLRGPDVGACARAASSRRSGRALLRNCSTWRPGRCCRMHADSGGAALGAHPDDPWEVWL